MYKKIALSGVILTAFLLPNNTAHANTYMNAVSKAVDHIVDTHKDTADTENDVVADPES